MSTKLIDELYLDKALVENAFETQYKKALEKFKAECKKARYIYFSYNSNFAESQFIFFDAKTKLIFPILRRFDYKYYSPSSSLTDIENHLQENYGTFLKWQLITWEEKFTSLGSDENFPWRSGSNQQVNFKDSSIFSSLLLYNGEIRYFDLDNNNSASFGSSNGNPLPTCRELKDKNLKEIFVFFLKNSLIPKGLENFKEEIIQEKPEIFEEKVQEEKVPELPKKEKSLADFFKNESLKINFKK